MSTEPFAAAQGTLTPTRPPEHGFRSELARLRGETHRASVERRLRKFYVPVPVKYALSLMLATAWLLFSIWVSRPWFHDLSNLTHPLFALWVLTFIAYGPGFMNAFLIFTLLQDRRPPRCPPSHYPGLSILVAAYQEERTIIHTLASLARERYPGQIEVLVLNDGSTDDTAEVARRGKEGLHWHPNVTVRLLDFPVNRGKSEVLNSGLELASHDLVVTVDADTRLRANSLTRIVERFLSDPEDTMAVAGAILVANSRDTLMAGMQEWDYFHGIAAVKRMQSMYHGTLVAQGAFSIYRRDALLKIGGWPSCVGEDIVMSWAMLREGWRVGYADDAVAFTAAPTRFRQFAHQRRRWARGMVEAFRHHGRLLVKPRLSTMFIWWNLLFLPMDLTFTFIFIPGVIMALLGHYWLAGPMTLLTLPLAALWNVIIFRIQQRMFRDQGLHVRRNYVALLFYILGYAVLMQPVSLWGYVSELVGRQKKWGTK